MDIRDFEIKTNVEAKPIAADGKTMSTMSAKQNVETENTNASREDLSDTDEDKIHGYKKFLLDNKISIKEMEEVLDTIVTDGEVIWTFQILGKIEAAFIMRPTWANEIVIRKLELEAPSTYARFVNVLNIYNLAGSLYLYGKKKFSPANEDDLNEVMLFLNKLPYPVFLKLIDQLVIFDRLIAVATSQWAIENFSTPPLDVSEQVP